MDIGLGARVDGYRAAAAAIAGAGLDLGLDLHDRLLARERDAPLPACPAWCGLYVMWPLLVSRRGEAASAASLDLGLDLHDRLLARERDAPLPACPAWCGLYVVWPLRGVASTRQ